MKRFCLAVVSLLAWVGSVFAADCSGTIATGGTAQYAIAASATQLRINGFTVCNIDAAAGSGEPLWINVNGVATAGAGSIPLAPPVATTFAIANGCYTTPPNFNSKTVLSVLATTGTHKYTCWWW